MRKTISIILAILLVMSSCSNREVGAQQGADSAAAWQDQYDLGIRYLSEGNYEEAIIAFTAAIEIDPNRAEAYVGRGDAYVGSGETEDNLTAALADYAAALELDETSAAAWLGLADVYIRQRNVDGAIKILSSGYEVTGSREILDLIEYLEEIAEDQWLFTDDMVEASELTISGIPFWELPIEQLAEYFPSDEESRDHSWIITDDRIQYTQVRNGVYILCAQQKNSSQRLDYVHLWEYSELRETNFVDDLPTILVKLGISAEGIEYTCSLAEQGHVIRFIKQGDFWREDIEHAGTISPGSQLEFIWPNYDSSQELILSFQFGEEHLLNGGIVYSFSELGY